MEAAVTEIVRTLILLWSLVGGHVGLHAEPSQFVVVADERGVEHRAVAAMECRDDGSGESDIWLAVDRPWVAVVMTLTHELAHAYDCLDDGEVNASPLPADAQLHSILYGCHSSLAEVYACWVVESGRIR